MSVVRTLENADLDPNDAIEGDEAAAAQEISDAIRLHRGEDLFDTTAWIDWYGLRMSKAAPAVYAEAIRQAILRVPLVASATVRTVSLSSDRHLSVAVDVQLTTGQAGSLTGAVDVSSAGAPSGARLYWTAM